MKPLVETGRFILTAVVVSLIIPALMWLRGGPNAFDIFGGSGGYVVVTTACFGLAVLGGALVGLPALWLARWRNWHDSFARMTIVGAFAGALAATLIAAPIYLPVFDSSELGPWAGFTIWGAVAGLIAAPTWVLLHRPDAGPETA